MKEKSRSFFSEFLISQGMLKGEDAGELISVSPIEGEDDVVWCQFEHRSVIVGQPVTKADIDEFIQYLKENQ